MDHWLAHGVFELRNVSTWNCSTIRSPWALSCYKPTSPHCFSRIFPVPCRAQASMLNGSDSSRRCPGWGQMPALVSSEDPGLPTALSSFPEHMAALLSFCVASGRNQGREETACVWVYLPYTDGRWLGCPDPGDWKCVWIHQLKQASGWFYDSCLVWQWESPLCRFKAWATPCPCLHLTLKLFSASLWYFLTLQQKGPSSTSLSLPPQLVPVIRGTLGMVGVQEQDIAWLLYKDSLHWWCAALGCLEQNRSVPRVLASLWPCGKGLPGVK